MKHHFLFDRSGKILGMAVVPSPASKLQFGPIPGRGQNTLTLDVPMKYVKAAPGLALNELQVKAVGKKARLVVRPTKRSVTVKKKAARKK